ncbi:MAG: efflux RND transporter periplasmic adaptor subunit [Planctomycetes bacterium]|nr:efflux RND transporter periplasmic adaptor subunit [Planctomycetota bacterium]
MLRMTTIGLLSQFLGRGRNAIAWCVLIGTVLCACLTACRDSGSNSGSAAESVAAAESGGHDGHYHGEEAHVDEVTLTRDAIDRYGIKVETASLYRLGPSFVAPARVAFNAEAIAHVGSTLPGRVVELAVRLGDVVTKGDLLLVVESPQLGEAQSDYLQN